MFGMGIEKICSLMMTSPKPTGVENQVTPQDVQLARRGSLRFQKLSHFRWLVLIVVVIGEEMTPRVARVFAQLARDRDIDVTHAYFSSPLTITFRARV